MMFVIILQLMQISSNLSRKFNFIEKHGCSYGSIDTQVVTFYSFMLSNSTKFSKISKTKVDWFFNL